MRPRRTRKSQSTCRQCADCDLWRGNVSSNVQTDSGSLGGSSVQSGSSSSTDAIVTATSSPANARRAVSISYRTQPNAQTSLRLSTTRPLACSGLMYAAVPSGTPIWLIAGGFACFWAGASTNGNADTTELPVPMSALPGASRCTSTVSSRGFARPKSRIFTVPSSWTLMLAGFRSR